MVLADAKVVSGLDSCSEHELLYEKLNFYEEIYFCDSVLVKLPHSFLLKNLSEIKYIIFNFNK